MENQSHGILFHSRLLRRGVSVRPGIPLHRAYHLRMDYLDRTEECGSKPSIRGHVWNGSPTTDSRLEPDHRVPGVTSASPLMGTGQCILRQHPLPLDHFPRSALE